MIEIKITVHHDDLILTCVIDSKSKTFAGSCLSESLVFHYATVRMSVLDDLIGLKTKYRYNVGFWELTLDGIDLMINESATTNLVEASCPFLRDAVSSASG
jgi:uncharacterized membrane protein